MENDSNIDFNKLVQSAKELTAQLEKLDPILSDAINDILKAILKIIEVQSEDIKKVTKDKEKLLKEYNELRKDYYLVCEKLKRKTKLLNLLKSDN